MELYLKLLHFLVLLNLSTKILAKENGVKWKRAEGKGLSLKNYTDKHVTAATCTAVECQSNCGRDDRCTASEFDSENSKCTYLYCNEIQVINKPGALTNIKGTIFEINYSGIWRIIHIIAF